LLLYTTGGGREVAIIIIPRASLALLCINNGQISFTIKVQVRVTPSRGGDDGGDDDDDDGGVASGA